MSDSGWVPKIAGREPSDNDGATYCGYVPPSYASNRSARWVLPKPSVVAADIENRGGQIDILMDDILQFYKDHGIQYSNRNYKILLGAVILCLRSDSEVQLAWEEMRKAAEQTSCLVAEARMDAMIELDSYKAQAPALIKFKLERRDFRFNSKSKPVDEGELAAIEKHQRLIEKQANDQR